MGRELKRVALDFDWPLHFRWPGYSLSVHDAVRSEAEGWIKRHHYGMRRGKDYTPEEISELGDRAYGCMPYPGFDPPEGDGYQIWETVSEGSPVTPVFATPVFATPEGLARWLVDNDTSVTQDTTFEGWMKFITGAGWAPSAMVGPDGIKSGVKAMTDRK